MFRRSRTPLVFTVAVLSVLVHTGRAQEPSIPTARAVVDRHIEAIGGAEAVRAVSSLRAVGRLEMPAQGLSGSLELLSARPARTRLRVDIPGLGVAESGYDGTVGWTLDPMMGPSLATGRALDEMKHDAAFDAVLYPDSLIKALDQDGRAEFDGKPAWKLRVVLEGGREQVEYFDIETGLQIGVETTTETPMGAVPTTTVLREYRKFGQLLQPTELVQRALGFEQIFRFTEYEYDGVPADAFVLPPAIRALVKRP